jgi:hypothetical protein
VTRSPLSFVGLGHRDQSTSPPRPQVREDIPVPYCKIIIVVIVLEDSVAGTDAPHELVDLHTVRANRHGGTVRVSDEYRWRRHPGFIPLAVGLPMSRLCVLEPPWEYCLASINASLGGRRSFIPSVCACWNHRGNIASVDQRFPRWETFFHPVVLESPWEHFQASFGRRPVWERASEFTLKDGRC